jgi:ankyrin repeat protein
MTGDTRDIVELREQVVSSEPDCPFCGYSLRGLTSDNCPECGRGIEEIGKELSRQRRVSLASPVLAWTMIGSLSLAAWSITSYWWNTFEYAWWERAEMLSLIVATAHLPVLGVGIWLLFRHEASLHGVFKRRWPWVACIWWIAIVGLHFLVAWQLENYHPIDGRVDPFTDALAKSDPALILREARRLDDINTTFSGQSSPLLMVVETGDLTLTKAVLDLGADVNLSPRWGYPALATPCRYRDAAMLQLLLDAGADTEVDVGFESTPLVYAAAEGSDDLVRLLLDTGARVDATGLRSRTALHTALGGFSGLGYLPAAGNRSAAALLLLEAGADPGQPDAEGQTPLMLAAAAGDLPVLQDLRRRSVVVDARDDRGRTALLYACREKQPAIVELLLDAGADPNIADDEGRTPLAMAVERDQPSLVEILLQGGADPHRTMIDGTPLPQLVDGESEPSTHSLRLVREYLDANQ